MDARSKPYFFAFDTKSKPGKILATCVRFETIEIDAPAFDETTFTLLHRDGDKRIDQLWDCVRNSS